jgi:tRNA-splicing ligase RtcB
MSCSHGAGRALGRKDAVRKLDLEAEQKIMEDQGIIHSLRTQEDLEEATSAYKDIHTVMEEQKDLVTPLIELKPLADIKGPTDEPYFKKRKKVKDGEGEKENG